MKAGYLCVIYVFVILGLLSGCKNTTTVQPPGGAFDPEVDAWKRSLNLDFENGNSNGWITGGKDCTIGVDSMESSGGSYSLRFSSTQGEERTPLGFGYIKLPVKAFRGKRVRLTARLRTQGLSGLFRTWIRADKGDDPEAFKQMNGLRGTRRWLGYTIEMDVPPGTTKLYVGGAMSGSGTAWLDNLEIESIEATHRDAVSVSGRVVDAANNPVPRAVIAAKTRYYESAAAVTTCDNDGNFQFNIPSGRYRLSVSAQGYTAGALGQFDVLRDMQSLVMTMGEDGFTIEGRVNVHGASLPSGSYVIANRLDFFDPLIYYTPVQSDGSFRITVPTGEAYRLDLDAPGILAVAAMTDKVMTPDAQRTVNLEAYAASTTPAEVTAWLSQQAIPLNTVEAGNGFADMQALKEKIGDARVVAMGESSHGQREIFQAKHRFFEFLVEEMGFTIFGLEAAWPECMAVNRYVLTGDGDPSRALSNLSRSWNTEEVLALVEWMRAYNADPAHTRKVQFQGLDVTSSMIGAENLTAYLQQVDPGYASQIEHILTVFRNPNVYNIVNGYSQEEVDAMLQNLDNIALHFDRQKSSYVASSSLGEWTVARHYAPYFRRFLLMALSATDYDFINHRDIGMAETVKWLLDTEPQGTKIMIWAHNFHISKELYPGYPFVFLGIHLRQMLEDDFIAVGFVFNQGKFQALDYTNGREEYRVTKDFSIEPYPGSFGHAMASTGMPLFFVDLRDLPGEGVVHNWFAAEQTFKWINSIYECEKDIKYLLKLQSIFDAVVFIETTTRARPLPSSGVQPPFPF